MKSRWRLLAIVVVILAVAGGVFGWQQVWRGNKGAPQVGRTIKISRGDIVRTVPGSGQVVANNEVTFAFNAEELVELKVAESEAVSEGQVLALLPSAKAELEMLKAQRAWEEARAEGIPSVIREKELEYLTAKENYEKKTVRAPWDGIVAAIARADGATDQYRITLLDRSELFIEVMINEVEIAQVALKQKGEATIDALPGEVWPVEVTRISPTAVSEASFGGAKVVPVTLRLQKADARVKPGFSAVVTITTAEAKGVLRVPVGSLTQAGQQGWGVMVMENGDAKLKPVGLGLISDQFAEVVSGLREGEEVLATPRGSPANR